MLTSESTNDQFHRFFEQNKRELLVRLSGLLNKKYRRTQLQIQKTGGETPNIFGTLKLGDISMYALTGNLEYNRLGIIPKSFALFLVMKDLRKQTKIMVTDSHPAAIEFSSHAVRRYRERIGLDNDLDFVEVCKHMMINGCCNPRSIIDKSEVYGTNINRRAVRLICTNGAFLGYYFSETGMLYAETFISSYEMREDQSYMDASKDPDLQQWKEMQELVLKGKMSIEEARERLLSPAKIALEDGRIKILTPEEIEKHDQEQEQFRQENPNFLQDQVEANRTRAEYRIKRKGYK